MSIGPQEFFADFNFNNNNLQKKTNHLCWLVVQAFYSPTKVCVCISTTDILMPRTCELFCMRTHIFWSDKMINALHSFSLSLIVPIMIIGFFLCPTFDSGVFTCLTRLDPLALALCNSITIVGWMTPASSTITEICARGS